MFQTALGTLLLLSLLLAPGAWAQPNVAAQHFDEGNRLFRDGAYREALAAYEQALASGYASSALYYNLGNTYYRLDELGQAIRYYEKARRLRPDAARIQHNLTVARSRITTPIASLPAPTWKTWWQRYVVRAGALPFFLTGFALYLIASVLLGQRLWSGTRNDWHRRALTLSALFGLVLLALAFAASLDRTLDRQVVVIASQTALRDTPQATAASEVNVPEGILLDVLGERDAWLEVRLPNGVTGWLRADATADV